MAPEPSTPTTHYPLPATTYRQLPFETPPSPRPALEYAVPRPLP
jgi:hypothetical protein